MAYKTEELKEKAIKVITDNPLIIFIEDVCIQMGISKPAFYDHFKKDSDDYNDLSNLIAQNKINRKLAIRKKWDETDHFGSQMALYKLCATPDELKALQQTYVEHSGELNEIHQIELIDVNTTDSDTETSEGIH